MQTQNRTRTQTKYKRISLKFPYFYKNSFILVRPGFKPDAGIVSAISSMKQNPKFSRLLGFSMNCLMPHLTPPNPKHRDNVNYLIAGNNLVFSKEFLWVFRGRTSEYYQSPH